MGSQALIGRFETACIPLVAEFGTDHIEKAARWVHIYITSFHSSRENELNKLTSLPTCGLIAQLVEHRTGIAEVKGSKPVEALIFSGFFFPIA